MGLRRHFGLGNALDAYGVPLLTHTFAVRGRQLVGTDRLGVTWGANDPLPMSSES